MRSLLLLILLASSVHADPSPTPPASSAPSSYLQLRAGLGVARYRETGPGFKFEAALQPFVLVGGEGGFPLGRGLLVLQASAGLGTEVDMKATSNGTVFQENQFRQEVYEASPRIRWPINPRVHFEGGYRLTVQRLFIIDVPMIGDALETVVVHAGEIGIVWHRTNPDTSRLQVELGLGFNRASAENDRIDGEDFGAGGMSLGARVQRQWASRLSVEGVIAYRKQNGSDVQTVTFDGMSTQAQWPNNTTWQLLVVAGYAIE